MEIIKRLILGGIGFALGFSLVVKSEWMLENFGRISWAEKHLGGGGTRMGYKLVGMLFIFFAFLYITGLWNKFISWALSPLTRLAG